MQFHEISAPKPSEESIRASYGAVIAEVNAAASADAALAAVDAWERVRRELDTYSSLVHLRFAQDVRDADRKADKEHLDALEPTLKEHDVALKRALLASPHRPALEAKLGANAFALWECAVTTYAPQIGDHVVRESTLTNAYTELLARAQVPFEGKDHTLSSMLQFFDVPERERRHAGAKAYFGWFAEHRDELDRLFGDLVQVRTEMAAALGYPSYTELGYRQMSRIDYTAADVDRFRAEVRDQVVPLCSELRKRQADALGLDRVMYWDEKVHDAGGSPRPKGDEAWMVAQARDMFDALHPELGAFFRMMADGGYLDLSARDGKAGGGFCTSFPSVGQPYIFANFNGTRGDVEVFTHEAGHAFQCWKSRNQPLTEYLFPTLEACEIHSMSLEFLTWPEMERFFGDDADAFRRAHLRESLLFIPYGVAVDHFQHLVYANPGASAAERFDMWKQVEAMYLPDRAYGDVPHAADGGFWQRQLHIFVRPFYYIDYTLAQTCALQFWARANDDFAGALDAYVKLCARGGEAPFQALARSAGLRSPFERGCLADAVKLAGATLLR